ncbi:MAG: small basic family protein [Chloroflexota bacterium]|nr:small basic family protein [Chloroflexota bacterium]
MWLSLLGLVLGLLIGWLFSISVSAGYACYMAVMILAAVDSVMGAIRAELAGEYDNRIFITGFLGNTLLAGLLTFLGDRLGVDLYYAAIFAFGVRLFNNLARIRRQLLTRFG